MGFPITYFLEFASINTNPPSLKSLFKNEKVIPFSVTKIWDYAIKNKILYGFESKEHFIHLTDLEIYNKLVKNN